MRITWIAAILAWTAGSASAQRDTGSDEVVELQDEALPRNRSTAERIADPNPTTEGVPWTFPIFWDQSVTVNSPNQLTNTTSYVWWFTAAPRWLFSNELSIGATETVSWEWTDAAQEEFNRLGFYTRELFWEDLRLDTTYIIAKRPADFMFVTAFDLRLPTSQFSRARERFVSPGVRFSVVRPFPVLSGMQLGVTSAFWYWFAGSNVVVAPDDVFPCRVAPTPGGGGGTIDADSCTGPLSATRHWTRLTGFFTLVPVDRLALGLTYTTLWARAFDLAVGCVETLTGEVCVDDNSGNDHWRTFSNFRFAIGYDITPYFTATASYDTWAQHPDSDGGRENPFYNENTRFLFTLAIRLSGLYASVRDKRASRAQRNREETIGVAKR